MFGSDGGDCGEIIGTLAFWSSLLSLLPAKAKSASWYSGMGTSAYFRLPTHFRHCAAMSCKITCHRLVSLQVSYVPHLAAFTCILQHSMTELYCWLIRFRQLSHEHILWTVSHYVTVWRTSDVPHEGHCVGSSATQADW